MRFVNESPVLSGLSPISGDISLKFIPLKTQLVWLMRSKSLKILVNNYNVDGFFLLSINKFKLYTEILHNFCLCKFDGIFLGPNLCVKVSTNNRHFIDTLRNCICLTLDIFRLTVVQFSSLFFQYVFCFCVSSFYLAHK